MAKEKKRRKRLPTKVIDELALRFPKYTRQTIINKIFHNDIEIVEIAARLLRAYERQRAKSRLEAKATKERILYGTANNVPI